MKHAVIVFVCFAAALSLPRTAAAQKHLTLETRQDREDKYRVALRKVFGRISDDDVVLSVLMVPSFIPEQAGGVLRSSSGYQAFVLTPSASTWETEYNQLIKESDGHGGIVPHPRKENLKKGLPLSYRGIKTRIQARPVSADVAERLKQLWQAKLHEALHPPPEPNDADRIIVTDGVTYYYSMPLKGIGRVTAEGLIAVQSTPVWLMGELADTLMAYAQGKASEEALKRALRRVETKKA